MKWVTRERARVDRIACPWLISRFVDRDAVFLFVPGDQVMAVAKRENAIPYDVPGVELGHHGDRCSFDAFLDKYKLDDPALQALALIVRGADTAARQLTPESAGLYVLATVVVSSASSLPSIAPDLPLPRCQELFSRMPFVPIVKLARATRARELAC